MPMAAILVLGSSLNFHAVALSQCVGPNAIEEKVHRSPGERSYTELGVWFGGQRKFECATKAFQSALKSDPSSAKLNFFVGLSLHSSGHEREAMIALHRSIQLDAKAKQPHLLLATILKQQGQGSAAEAQWQTVLSLDPTSKEALDGLSTSMIDRGDPAAAIALLKDVPRDEDLNIDMVRAYGEAQMLDEAAAIAEKTLAADPSSLRLTNVMVTVMVQQRHFLEAAELLKKFVEEHPSDVAAQIAYLSALVLNKDSVTARTLGAKLLGIAPHDFQVLYLNGILEREAGEYQIARDHEREAVAIDPENYGARYNLGAVLAHLSDMPGARVQLEKAIALDGSKPEPHFQLASVLRSLGDTTGAQAQLAIYKQLTQANLGQTRAKNDAAAADQKLAAGDTEQAVALYREAVANAPKDALLSYKYSVALDKAGDAAGEQIALENAIKIDPTLALAQNQLGFLLSRGGDPAGAEVHFRLAVEAAPAFTEAWINLAATLGQEQQLPKARQAIATALRLEPDNAQARELNDTLKPSSHTQP